MPVLNFRRHQRFTDPSLNVALLQDGRYREWRILPGGTGGWLAVMAVDCDSEFLWIENLEATLAVRTVFERQIGKLRHDGWKDTEVRLGH